MFLPFCWMTVPLLYPLINWFFLIFIELSSILINTFENPVVFLLNLFAFDWFGLCQPFLLPLFHLSPILVLIFLAQGFAMFQEEMKIDVNFVLMVWHGLEGHYFAIIGFLIGRFFTDGFISSLDRLLPLL